MYKEKFPWKNLKLKKFKTSDNAIIYYHFQQAKINSKKTIIINLAWNMSPDVFSPLLLTNKKIINYYDVYIVIVRGYIEDINYGNDINRCSTDLKEFINYKKIKKMTILGHSIGNAIWWQWIKNFGTKYIEKFILIDEIACLTKNPQNSIKTNLDLGSIVSQNQLYESYNILIKGNNESKIYRENLINNHFSNKFKIENPEIMYEIFKKVNLYGFNSTSNILFSNLTQNWINLLLNNKINIPTYLFGGINSNVPYQSIIYQKQYYKNSQIYIFEGETSSHFAFMENYKLFNKLLKKFL